jgi:predicted  nucleic acid-binding Zn-ribbon protein
MAVAYFIMSGNQIIYLETENLTPISPYVQEFTQVSKLYFVHNEHLVSEMRTLNIELLEVEFSALKALKKGPKIESYRAPISEDVDIISLSTSDRICYVNLSTQFANADPQELELNITAIVNTLTEFVSIDYVQILVDGKKITGVDNAYDEPLSKNTSLMVDSELSHKDVMRKFLDHIVQGRYDLAYDLIDQDSKKKETFRTFAEAAAAIRQTIDGYTQTYIIATREQGRYIIQVRYVLRDSPAYNDLLNESDVRSEVPLSWPMIQENGLWKVKFYPY